jgi:hypothetical protein
MGGIIQDGWTIADTAQPAAFRFGRIIRPTSGAGIFRTLKGQA